MKDEINPNSYMNFNNLKRIRETYLGTGTMIEYMDLYDGKAYYFKYAQSRYEDATPQPYKANKSECGYKIQRLVDEDTAVKCETITLEGHYGSIQEVLKTNNNMFNLRAWQDGRISSIPKHFLDDLLREFVTDYLLCNFDAHPGNFIIREDGKMIGIDKEQAFKYINEDGAKHLTYTYHPNEVFHEREPIYNTIFRRYAQGKLDLDFNPIIEKIEKIKKIDINQYREIFRKNVEMNSNQECTSEAFIDKIVERKENFLEEFTNFKQMLDNQRMMDCEKE